MSNLLPNKEYACKHISHICAYIHIHTYIHVCLLTLSDYFFSFSGIRLYFLPHPLDSAMQLILANSLGTEMTCASFWPVHSVASARPYSLNGNHRRMYLGGATD